MHATAASWGIGRDIPTYEACAGAAAAAFLGAAAADFLGGIADDGGTELQAIKRSVERGQQRGKASGGVGGRSLGCAIVGGSCACGGGRSLIYPR